MVAQVKHYQPVSAVEGAAEKVLEIMQHGGILYTDMELWQNGKKLYAVRYAVVDHLIKQHKIILSADQSKYIPASPKHWALG